MANAATNLTASPTPPAVDTAPRHAVAVRLECWVDAIGWVALVVFIALPIGSWVFEAYAGGLSGRL
jgi:hypothetical protein